MLQIPTNPADNHWYVLVELVFIGRLVLYSLVV